MDISFSMSSLPKSSFDFYFHCLPDGSQIRTVTIRDLKLCQRFGRDAPFTNFPWSLAQAIQSITSGMPPPNDILNPLISGIRWAMQFDIEDVVRFDTLLSEFRNGFYTIVGITICYNILSLSVGNPVYIGNRCVGKLRRFWEATNVGLITLEFDDGGSKILPKHRLPFTNEARLWIDVQKGNWSLPTDWFPRPPCLLEQQKAS
jgi:hypothetical protein